MPCCHVQPSIGEPLPIGKRSAPAMPVQGDMIFTLGTNPVAQAMGKAAEPRRVQVLRSHPRAGQENNSFAAPHPGHLASAGAAVLDILTCTWKAEKHVPPSACPLPAIILHHPPPPTMADKLESRASKVRIPRPPRPSALPYWLVDSRLALPNQSRYKRLHNMASETRARRAAALNPSIEVKSTLRSRRKRRQQPRKLVIKVLENKCFRGSGSQSVVLHTRFGNNIRGQCALWGTLNVSPFISSGSIATAAHLPLLIFLSVWTLAAQLMP